MVIKGRAASGRLPIAEAVKAGKSIQAGDILSGGHSQQLLIPAVIDHREAH
jgi:hypothetical protein